MAKRAQKPKPLVLRGSSESDGFTTLDALSGLHGVCTALDELFSDRADINHAHNLVMAANVLSTILINRVGDGT